MCAIHQEAVPLEHVRFAMSFLRESEIIRLGSSIARRERMQAVGLWYRQKYLRLPLDSTVGSVRICYDYVGLEEVSTVEYLARDPFNIVLVQVSPGGVLFATGSNKGTIMDTVNSFYIGRVPNIVSREIVLYQLHGRLPVYVQASTLSALLVSRSRMFRVRASELVYPLTIGVDTYHGRNSPFEVGMSHCTPGTDKRVSTICRVRPG